MLFRYNKFAGDDVAVGKGDTHGVGAIAQVADVNAVGVVDRNDTLSDGVVDNDVGNLVAAFNIDNVGGGVGEDVDVGAIHIVDTHIGKDGDIGASFAASACVGGFHADVSVFFHFGNGNGLGVLAVAPKEVHVVLIAKSGKDGVVSRNNAEVAFDGDNGRFVNGEVQDNATVAGVDIGTHTDGVGDGFAICLGVVVAIGEHIFVASGNGSMVISGIVDGDDSGADAIEATVGGTAMEDAVVCRSGVTSIVVGGDGGGGGDQDGARGEGGREAEILLLATRDSGVGGYLGGLDDGQVERQYRVAVVYMLGFVDYGAGGVGAIFPSVACTSGLGIGHRGRGGSGQHNAGSAVASLGRLQRTGVCTVVGQNGVTKGVGASAVDIGGGEGGEIHRIDRQMKHESSVIGSVGVIVAYGIRVAIDAPSVGTASFGSGGDKNMLLGIHDKGHQHCCH